MAQETPAGRLRSLIERRTGRTINEILRELSDVPGQDAIRMACACSALAGENVSVSVVEKWVAELEASDREERWAVLVPKVRSLFESLVAEEVERRISAMSKTAGANNVQRADAASWRKN